MDVSVVIVNYNTKTLLRECLASIYRHTGGLEFEVIVSDNASRDGSTVMIRNEFPRVMLLENEKNLGFGAANNRGLDRARGDFIFYLNSDTLLLNNGIKIFFDYWRAATDAASLGALGCVLLDSGGRPVHSFGSFYRAVDELKEKFSGPPDKPGDSLSLPKEVGYICGAALFLKRDGYARFDERFFLYYEDNDLQLKLAQAGKKRLLIPGPKIVHLEGKSNTAYTALTLQGSFSRIHWTLSRIKYYQKRRDNPGVIFILILLAGIKWLNPLVIRKTCRFFPELLKIFLHKPS
jgi:GT2 family glycosyltransferase